MAEIAEDAEASIEEPLERLGDVLLAWLPAGDLSDGDLFCRIGVGERYFVTVYPDTGDVHTLSRDEYELEYDVRPPRTFKDFPRKGLNYILLLRSKRVRSTGQFFRAHEDPDGFAEDFLRESGAVESELELRIGGREI